MKSIQFNTRKNIEIALLLLIIGLICANMAAPYGVFN
jgi:hypothetical protein